MSHAVGIEDITAMRYVFWASLTAVIYTYILYPILLVCLVMMSRIWRSIRSGWKGRDAPLVTAQERTFLPTVSLVFAAFNEQSVIAAKMLNCRALDYPSDSFETLIGCDGCTDHTAELARANRSSRTCVLEYGVRSGKPTVLNRLLARARGEIVVFTDANTMLDPQSIRNLVRHFANPSVGCVSGLLHLRNPRDEPGGEGLYWRYETFLKTLEGRLNMLLGANGAIFAIRRELYSALPPGCVVDDFVISMRIRARGHGLLLDPAAVAFEVAAPSVRGEFSRHARIGAGNFQAIRYTWKLLNPFSGRIGFAYWSHKILRWLVPFAMMAAFVSSVALFGELPYRMAALGFSLFGLMGVWGYWQETQGRRTSLVIPYYFLAMNAALFLGFIRFIRGSQPTAWQRTAREDTSG